MTRLSSAGPERTRGTNPWLKASALAVAMPLAGIAILVLWFRITFHWETDYVQPWYWAPLVILALCLIWGAPVPLLWMLIKATRTKKGALGKPAAPENR